MQQNYMFSFQCSPTIHIHTFILYVVQPVCFILIFALHLVCIITALCYGHRTYGMNRVVSPEEPFQLLATCYILFSQKYEIFIFWIFRTRYDNWYIYSILMDNNWCALIIYHWCYETPHPVLIHNHAARVTVLCCPKSLLTCFLLEIS